MNWYIKNKVEVEWQEFKSTFGSSTRMPSTLIRSVTCPAKKHSKFPSSRSKKTWEGITKSKETRLEPWSRIRMRRLRTKWSIKLRRITSQKWITRKSTISTSKSTKMSPTPKWKYSHPTTSNTTRKKKKRMKSTSTCPSCPIPFHRWWTTQSTKPKGRKDSLTTSSNSPIKGQEKMRRNSIKRQNSSGRSKKKGRGGSTLRNWRRTKRRRPSIKFWMKRAGSSDREKRKNSKKNKTGIKSCSTHSETSPK